MSFNPSKDGDFDDEDDEFLVEALERIEDKKCDKHESSNNLSRRVKILKSFEVGAKSSENLVVPPTQHVSCSSYLGQDIITSTNNKVENDKIMKKLENNMLNKELKTNSSKSPVFSEGVQRRSLNSPGYNHSLIRKRKFPGPAGLLPSWESRSPHNNKTSRKDLHSLEGDGSFSLENSICSQMSAEDFCSGPWSEMVHDFGFIESDSKCPLHVFNIRNLRKPTQRDVGGSGVKMEFLAVIILSIDYSSGITANFKDRTGEISGTITSTVIDKYGAFICGGSLLILKDVSVLSPVGSRIDFHRGLPKQSHYLTITMSSIAAIYSLDENDEIVVSKILPLSSEDVENFLVQRSSKIKTIVEEREQIIDSKSSLCLFENLDLPNDGELSNKKPMLFSTVRDQNFKAPRKFSSPRRIGANVNFSPRLPSPRLAAPIQSKPKLPTPKSNINNGSKEVNVSASKSFTFKSNIFKDVKNNLESTRNPGQSSPVVQTPIIHNLKQNAKIIEKDKKAVHTNPNFDMFDDDDDSLFASIDIDSLV